MKFLKFLIESPAEVKNLKVMQNQKSLIKKFIMS